MTVDNTIWVLSGIIHVTLAFLLMRHKLPRFTLLIVMQLLKIPVVYYFHQHDLTNLYYWDLYTNVFCILRAVDVVLAFLAVNETMHTEYHWISRGLEMWLMSQLLVYGVVARDTAWWSVLENVSNGIYLISALLWIKLLWEPNDDI